MSDFEGLAPLAAPTAPQIAQPMKTRSRGAANLAGIHTSRQT
jgi:hypothetical protein